MKKIDIAIISHLRQNGRMPLTDLSRKTEMPVSTLHERLKHNIKRGVLRPTAALDFTKIGFPTRAHILLAAEEKEKMLEYLGRHPNVNSLSRINNGWSLIMECAFKDMYSLEEFVEKLENTFHIRQKEIHYVIAEIKREAFMANPETAEAVFPKTKKPSKVKV